MGYVKQMKTFAHQRGVSLVETLMAVTITGIAVTALLWALSTGSMAVRTIDHKTTADTLAKAQMEHTKDQTFVSAPTTYTSVTPVPSGYSVSAQASSISGRDSDIQKITVTVTYDGDTILTIDGYKMNR